MRLAPFAALLLAGLSFAAPEPKPQPPAPAFNLDRRVPWDTSHVAGSPEPPHPYRTIRAFPKLKVTNPIGIANEPGSNRLLVIHQHSPWGGAGRIVRIRDDDAIEDSEVFLDIDGIAYGVAFHPDFAKNGYFYVGLNGPMQGKKQSKVVRYTIDRKPPHKILSGSATVIIAWDSDGHNGADLAFGNDGMLYVTSGDGTSDSDTNLAGQDLTKLLSKVLRIDVDHPDPGKHYSVPKDNPFVGQKNIRPETWAYGFRASWRLHIDRKTGDVWVGMNGQDLWEAAYLVEKGANYGWSVMEGSHPFYLNRKAGPHPFSKPIVEHHHSEFRSLTGGVVYYGDKLPELRGAYIYGDFSTGRIWGVRHKAGKVVWNKELVDTPFQITGFGLDAKGELLIVDHGGGFYRLETNPPLANPPKFPTKLSETGLFLSIKDHQPQPGLITYSVNAQLWSDGAHKERFIAIPGLGQIDYMPSRGWNFPDGAVLVKTFSLDMEAGKPASRRRIETRLLVKQQSEWAGFTYVWNDAQTDAVLVGSGGTDQTFTIRDPSTKGGERKQIWHYPSRAECMVCHSRAANYVLGLTTLQMNREHDYGTAKANQLLALERLGVFRLNALENVGEIKPRLKAYSTVVSGGIHASLAPLRRILPASPAPVRRLLAGVDRLLTESANALDKRLFSQLEALEKDLRETTRYTTLLPKRPEVYGRLVDPSDRTQPLEARARSYLHANCAQCHVEAGGGNAMMELEFTTPRDKMRTIDAKPLHDTFQVPDAKLIEPGHPEKSMLYLRLTRRGQGQMPPLATATVDREASQLIHDWIKEMSAPKR